MFNTYFVAQNYLNDQNHTFPFKSPFQKEPLSKIEVSSKEIYWMLRSLDSKKATGPDGIGNALLKLTASGTAKSVRETKLIAKPINLSLSLGKFPSNWKLANVVPIYKKGNVHKVENYRPVSLLSCLSKVAERVVANRLRKHLSKHSILNPMQSGFRKKHSTQTQLAALLHDISEAVDSGKKVRAVFLDISKAFDRVSHKALVITLRSIGISGETLAWFESYLSGRSQRVVIDGKCSDYQRVLAGVPQGSVLGPLLFIIFINDLIEQVDCSVHVYADDTMLFKIGDSFDEVDNALEVNLAKAANWGEQWLVEFNQSKTVAMSFGQHTSSRSLLFRGAQVSDSFEHKHLGVILQSDLKWSKHLDMVAEKAEGSLRYLTVARHHVAQDVLSNIYTTLIRPTMEYCCSIWSSIPVSASMKLQKIENRAARLVTGAPMYTQIESLHSELGWDYLENRRKYFRLTFYHKILIGEAPLYLSERLPLHNHNYNTRQNQTKTYKYNYSFFKNSLLPMATREYNDLPAKVRKNSSNEESQIKTSTFREKLKAYFLEQGFFKNKPPVFYRWGSRSGNTLHCSLRMGYTRLNLHTFMYHNKGDPGCRVCQVDENEKHFLLHCQLFETQRSKMIDNIRDLLLASDNPEIASWLERPNKCLEILLWGANCLQNNLNWQVFQSVHTYISETHRFTKEFEASQRSLNQVACSPVRSQTPNRSAFLICAYSWHCAQCSCTCLFSTCFFLHNLFFSFSLYYSYMIPV